MTQAAPPPLQSRPMPGRAAVVVSSAPVGEEAVGSSLLCETWPRRWRPWMAAVLQSGVNLGILIACLAVYVMAALPPRTVFLVGILPALLVFWIRRNVPEPAEWVRAREEM